MALRLHELGYGVVVWDIDPGKRRVLERNGLIVQHPRQFLAMNLIACVVCVVNAIEATEALLGVDGVCNFLRPGSAVVLCPTISPEDVQSIAAQLHRRGFGVIEAPMSGGPLRARDGTMSLMVACEPELLATHRQWLSAVSSQIFHIGEKLGDGARTKLVNNLLAGIHLVGVSEVLALAAHMGLDLTKTLDVMSQSSGQSWIGSDRMRRAVAQEQAPQARQVPQAHMGLLAKDTALALKMAQTYGVNVPIGAMVAERFSSALLAGLGMKDDSEMLRFHMNLLTLG